MRILLCRRAIQEAAGHAIHLHHRCLYQEMTLRACFSSLRYFQREHAYQITTAYAPHPRGRATTLILYYRRHAMLALPYRRPLPQASSLFLYNGALDAFRRAEL